MYATTTIIKHSKKSGRIFGVHQRVNKLAHGQFLKLEGRRAKFPTIKEVQYFEGTNGPDGLKRKSPDQDGTDAFLEPDNDDGRLIKQIMNHHHNLVVALRKGDMVKASFSAAWMAHDVVDGLTPAHHYPYVGKKKEMRDGRDFLKIFGIKTQGLMPGDNLFEVLKNNWLYLGPDGMFTEHALFEFGVAMVTAPTRDGVLRRMPTKEEVVDLRKVGFQEMYYRSVRKVYEMGMYTKFLEQGWTTELALETKKVLIPEAVKCVTMAWMSAYEKVSK
ncbi:hypothetical protein FWD07_01490 [Candidatus Saccharibacteria bacterium]|nr:hypothetical protein [Candidatus Saccharibacteria bacterium]